MLQPLCILALALSNALTVVDEQNLRIGEEWYTVRVEYEQDPVETNNRDESYKETRIASYTLSLDTRIDTVVLWHCWDLVSRPLIRSESAEGYLLIAYCTPVSHLILLAPDGHLHPVAELDGVRDIITLYDRDTDELLVMIDTEELATSGAIYMMDDLAYPVGPEDKDNEGYIVMRFRPVRLEYLPTVVLE